MNDFLFNMNSVRIETSFKSLDELRLILSFYQRNNLLKVNIPSKNFLKKDFLINAIKVSRNEFPSIDIIPHFSIQHEFKRNKTNTLDSLIEFIQIVKHLGCKQILLVSGSQRKSTLDSVSALSLIKQNPLINNDDCISIGVAFNPYLASPLFEEEMLRLEEKLKSGLVSSIWIQFGTDNILLEKRLEILLDFITSAKKNNPKFSYISIYGSILIPSKQFLARFKFRPWKGVYCSESFLESVEYATIVVRKLLKTYQYYKISPIIETNITSEAHLNLLRNFSFR
tara:strand:- start:3136 stop:3984 length:849 start_codon:yes stop_codon:yes gene_type:complete